MNNKLLSKILLLIFIFLNIKITVVSAATISNEDLKILNDRVVQLEKENKSLKEDLGKLNKDELVKSYREQNESILKTTDVSVKNITNLISTVAIIITLLTAVGAIAIPLIASKKEKERFDEIKNKIADIEKSLDSKIQNVTTDLAIKESSITDLSQKLNSLMDDVNRLLTKAENSAKEAKKSEDISRSYSLQSEAFKLFDDKKYNLAFEKLNKAIELNPNDAVLFHTRGVLYDELQKYDLALQDFNNALNIAPNDFLILFSRGVLHDKQKKYDLALQDYNASLNINPNNIKCINNKANLYRKIGNLDLASQEIAVALSIESNYPYALSTAAELALTKNDKEEFYKNIEKAFGNGLPLNIVYKDNIYKKVLDEPRFKELLEKYKNN